LIVRDFIVVGYNRIGVVLIIHTVFVYSPFFEFENILQHENKSGQGFAGQTEYNNLKYILHERYNCTIRKFYSVWNKISITCVPLFHSQ
jgi:hypothetical protein